MSIRWKRKAMSSRWPGTDFSHGQSSRRCAVSVLTFPEDARPSRLEGMRRSFFSGDPQVHRPRPGLFRKRSLTGGHPTNFLEDMPATRRRGRFRIHRRRNLRQRPDDVPRRGSLACRNHGVDFSLLAEHPDHRGTRRTEVDDMLGNSEMLRSYGDHESCRMWKPLHSRRCA